MAAKPRKNSAIWLPCSSSDLVVGDAIIYSTIVTKGRHGQAVRITKGASTFEVPRRVEIVGRVIGIERSKIGKGYIVERTGIHFDAGMGEEEDLVLPPVVDLVLASALDDEMAYLRSRLHAAAGGDHRSRAAVQRVSECVLPFEIQRAKASDEYPDAVQMGIEAATKMLAGEDLYSESVVRQLRRQVVVERSVPWTDTPRPASAPKPKPKAKAEAVEGAEPKTKAEPTPTPTLSVVEAIGDVDPDVAAIMAMFPGTKVRDVRMLEPSRKPRSKSK
jgi:hypothetical protein